MRTFSVEGKTVSLFTGTVPDAPLICLNTFSGEGAQVFQALQQAECPPCTLVAVSNLAWDHDMAPWDSPPAFRNGAPFSGGADAYLHLLTETILPQTEQFLAAPPRWHGIAGYSLAGLFAVYAICQTPVFSRVASVSGSLWFPGIREYLFSHPAKCRPDCMYFSLGDKECRTRNPILQTVQQNTQAIQAFYQQQGIETIFQSNPGNHHDHAAARTAAGIAWLLRDV